MKENIAISKEYESSTCMNCLEKVENIPYLQIVITDMGYGSYFDGWGTKIILCKKCMEETKITDLVDIDLKYEASYIEGKIKEESINLTDDYYSSCYNNEDNIFKIVKSFPLAGRELFYNRFSHGWSEHYMEPQDYIDYELKILPYDKCKEYQLYAIEEIESYRNNFTTCKHPINYIYEDGSKGCACIYGAKGRYNQQIEKHNISSECNNCSHYNIRELPIKEMTREEYDELKTYIISKENYLKFKDKYEIIIDTD